MFMNQLLIITVVLLVFLLIIMGGRRYRVEKADEEKESRKAEKDKWSKENVRSEKEIQTTQSHLHSTINDQIGSDNRDGKLLKKIVDEWAELKIKRFTERRSWVRNPDQEKE
jgi:cell division protein FtsB